MCQLSQHNNSRIKSCLLNVQREEYWDKKEFEEKCEAGLGKGEMLMDRCGACLHSVITLANLLPIL